MGALLCSVWGWWSPIFSAGGAPAGAGVAPAARVRFSRREVVNTRKKIFYQKIFSCLYLDTIETFYALVKVWEEKPLKIMLKKKYHKGACFAVNVL